MKILIYIKYKSFIHFGLTSQDINNNSITLSIKNCIEEIIIPKLEDILANLLDKSLQWSETCNVESYTWTISSSNNYGKEIKVFHYRISKQLEQLKNIDYYGKLGGASGNLNAHYCVSRL